LAAHGYYVAAVALVEARRLFFAEHVNLFAVRAPFYGLAD
jgi:hypothetical protein